MSFCLWIDFVSRKDTRSKCLICSLRLCVFAREKWILSNKMNSAFPHCCTPGRHRSRREFLWSSGGGLGGIALAALLGSDAARAEGARPLDHPAKAKRVVQLFMAGAASHIDLFDFKPELIKRHGQPSDFGEHVEAFQKGLGPGLKPLWDFKPYGKSGKLLSEVVSPLGDVVDDMAF